MALQEGHGADRLRDVLQLLSGEWSPDVLFALACQPMHYTELLATVQAVGRTEGWSFRQHQRLQDSVLHRTLRRLQERELVASQRDTSFPFTATYHLTSAAGRLLESTTPLITWTDEHTDLIDRARRRQRSRNANPR